MKKFIASLIVSALVITAPGLASYAVAGQVLSRSAARSSVVAGRMAPRISKLDLSAAKLSGAFRSPTSLSIPAGLKSQPAALAVQTAAQTAAQAPTRTTAVSGARQEKSLGRLLEQKEELALPAEKIAALSHGEIRSAASGAMDKIVGFQSVSRAEGSVTGAASDSPRETGLVPARAPGGSDIKPPVPPTANGDGPAPQGPRGSKALAFVKSVLRVGAGAVAVHALGALGVGLPFAAIWAVSSGVFVLPAALWARSRLARHDSPSLTKVKWLVDVLMGAYIGALAATVPSLALVMNSVAAAPGAAQVSLFAVPMMLVGSVFASQSGGGLLNTTLGAGALLGLPAAFGVVGAGGIGLVSLVGMWALPALMTVAFFVGRIIYCAETGRPFAVPGSLQKMRFPSYNWVMMGVVYALTTGHPVIHSNLAFMAWTFLGDRDRKAFFAKAFSGLAGYLGGKAFSVNRITDTLRRWAAVVWAGPVGVVIRWLLDFDRLFVGVSAIAIGSSLLGYASPLTGLALAFSAERAAHWTERLLMRLLPLSAPAPSSAVAPAADPFAVADKPVKAPRYHHWLKTGLILATMASLGYGLGASVFGFASLLKNLAISGTMAAIPFFLSNRIIKLVMRTTPADETQDPEFFAVMRELRERINAKREAKGKKAIPMPEMVIDPMPVPNAYATGRDPFHATVGVTVGTKEMLLDPENTRASLVRLIGTVDPAGKPFKVFRKSIGGSIPGVTDAATPQEVSQALMRAAPEDVKKLGVRLLRGIMGHEFSHVMDRHMLTGSISGAISSGVAFACYGVLWAAGHAAKLAASIEDWVKDRLQRRSKASASSSDRATGPSSPDSKIEGAKPEFIEPISGGLLVAKSLATLLKYFAAEWAPVIMSIIQMAGSRNNESQADEDGASLTEEPESLALALGLLMTWQPRRGFSFAAEKLPLLAAISHLCTVNPLEQLAGAATVADKADDAIFNLFITHPDTTKRIEMLFDISEAMDAHGGRSFRAKPPPGDRGGGDQAPPLAFRPSSEQSAPNASARGGFFRGIWEKAKGLFRVFPDENRNREFWKYRWAMALVNIGVSFHWSARNGLADPGGKNPGRVGANLAVNSGAQLSGSIVSGPIVDRSSPSKVMAWSFLGRSLLLVSVPILFFHGYLAFAALQAITIGLGFLQNTSMTAGSVAFGRILGDDESHYNKANAVGNLIDSVVGFTAPLAAGWFIAFADARFHLLAGNALSYGIYGALMLATAAICFMLRVPSDQLTKARTSLAEALEGDPRVKGVRAKRVIDKGSRQGVPTLVVEVSKDLADTAGIPKEYAGFPVSVEVRPSWFHELRGGFKSISGDHFLTWYLLCSTVSVMVADPLIFSALPRYINEVLPAVSLPAFLTDLPLLGGALKSWLSDKNALFTLYLAAAPLGMGLSSLLLMMLRDPSVADLEYLARGFKDKLAERGLDDKQAAAGKTAVKEAVGAVIERYTESFRQDPAAQRSGWEFRKDLLDEAASRINAAVFGGAKSASELDRLLAETGLLGGLPAWAEEHSDDLLKSARKEAKSGLTTLERQGRWTSFMSAAGWLLYWGVFFSGGLWGSVLSMMIAMLLQGPCYAVWSSIVQRVVNERHPENMGQIYGSISFYQLLFSAAGAFILSSVMQVQAAGTALVVAGAVVSMIALVDIIEPFIVFPLRRKGPKA